MSFPQTNTLKTYLQSPLRKIADMIASLFHLDVCHRTLSSRMCLVAFVLIVAPTVTLASDNDATQKLFPTYEAAGNALVMAAKADDIAALNSILGPDAKQIISSGDPVADDNARENFVSNFQEMHRYAYNDQGRVTLIVGAENWPLPIPLVKKDGGGWMFDTAAGKDEMLYRRIGGNELFTIKVLKDLVGAQKEYASDKGHFAEKILSDPGKQNGLYWPTVAGQPESPIGPLVASAALEGYKPATDGAPPPFHGYYYRELSQQGANARGGARRYSVEGKMSNGFAFVAYPAEYRSSGVVTFMVNQDGTIVQKDLGPQTEEIARELSSFDPDKTWDEDLER